MKKLLIGLVLCVAPSVICLPFGKDSTADKFVGALQDIAQSANLVDDTIDAIEKISINDVTTNLRRLDCSEKGQEEKVVILTKLYAVATEVSDQQEKVLETAFGWSPSKRAYVAVAKEIEQLVLDRLDAERMPQGNIKEDTDAVYAAIATSDVQRVKDALRTLDRKNLFGKPLELVLKGFEKASSQLVDDYAEDLSLPRNASDSFKVKLGAGLAGAGILGMCGGVRFLGRLPDIRRCSINEKLSGINGTLATLASVYPLWKGLRRSDQRTLLANATEVHDHIVMRLNKVVPPTAVERQAETVTFKDFEYAIKASDFDKVQSLVWDLECSYLDEEAQQEIIDRAATYAAELLTKREEDMAYTGSWKKLKIDSLLRRSWKDTAKLVGGGIVIVWNVFDQIKNRRSALLSKTNALVSTVVAGYLTRDGWNRTTQKQQLKNALEIKQLLRSKAN